MQRGCSGWQCSSLACGPPHSLSWRRAALQQVFCLSDAAWADAVYSKPVLLASKPDTALGVVAWLHSPAVGMVEADVLRLFQRDPALFKHSPDGLSAKLEWLLRRLELPQSAAALVLLRCATFFTKSKCLLDSHVLALEAYGEALHFGV